MKAAAQKIHQANAMAESLEPNPVLARALATLARTEPTPEDLAEMEERTRRNEAAPTMPMPSLAELQRRWVTDEPMSDEEFYRMKKLEAEERANPKPAPQPAPPPAQPVATRKWVGDRIEALAKAVGERFAQESEAMDALYARVTTLEVAAAVARGTALDAAAGKPRVRIPAPTKPRAGV